MRLKKCDYLMVCVNFTSYLDFIFLCQKSAENQKMSQRLKMRFNSITYFTVTVDQVQYLSFLWGEVNTVLFELLNYCIDL